ncbi:MAG TPA: DUF222 domain-containing protein [Nocardioidaceae bacterium]|nr:DUF222 domain-containing protein [Nocardioidaceae bacterium]
MFDDCAVQSPGTRAAARSAGLCASDIEAMARSLVDASDTAERAVTLDDAARIDAIRALEELKSTAAAAQARLSVEFADSQVAAQASVRVPAARRGRGVAAQIALARRESPVRGGRHLGLARALTREMPQTYAALQHGLLSEWRATLLVRETACLSAEDRAEVDRRIAADTGAVEGWGDRRLIAETRKLTYKIDPESVVRRARKAESERNVTTRPAPDTMCYLTGLLPVAQGVACHVALMRAADAARAAGDERSRGQVMADTLVERVTGQAAAAGPPVRVNLTMSDRSLLGGDSEPAHLEGYGTVPAQWARDLVRHAASEVSTGLATGEASSTSDATGSTGSGGAGAWIRRLFSNPETGELVAMTSRSRLVPKGLADFIATRDRTCRTPWCDAPIRHSDHVVPADAGGETSDVNGEGLCEACNYAKQAPGWRARPSPGPRHAVESTTPTGHRYRSIAPRAPGSDPPDPMPIKRRPPITLELYRCDVELRWAPDVA